VEDSPWHTQDDRDDALAEQVALEEASQHERAAKEFADRRDASERIMMAMDMEVDAHAVDVDILTKHGVSLTLSKVTKEPSAPYRHFTGLACLLISLFLSFFVCCFVVLFVCLFRSALYFLEGAVKLFWRDAGLRGFPNGYLSLRPLGREVGKGR
jgi:hypothetical protein